MIYNRDNEFVSVIADQTQSIADIKQKQVIGYDNLVVTSYVYNINGPVSIPVGTTAEYTAVFTYTNPPSNAFVTMTWDYNLSGTSGIFAVEYAPYQYITDTTQRRFIFRFTPITGAVTSVDITSYSNSTQDGTLVVTRTL